MNCIVVGLGVQGNKRIEVLGENLVSTVDKYHTARYKSITDVPTNIYSTVFNCVPDDDKLSIIEYCILNSKNIMVEKPLILRENQFKNLENRCNEAGILLTTAYNHRFEPHIHNTKKLLEKERIGKILGIRIYYGNGTAHLVRKTKWKNEGLGVGIDIGSHLMDLLLYFFGKQDFDFNSRSWSYITDCPDRVVILGNFGQISVNMEMTYLSWKNTFELEIYGDEGTIKINSLCKWSESILYLSKRVHPAGIPEQTQTVASKGDTTWALEIDNFFKNIKNSTPTDLSRDSQIQSMLISAGLEI